MKAIAPKRPRRAPDRVFSRPSDGAEVEVWVRQGSRRSRDRVVDGSAYFRCAAAVAGSMVWEDPKRHPSEEDALAEVARLFPVGSVTL